MQQRITCGNFQNLEEIQYENLLKNAEMSASFERILPNLNENEQFQLNRLLKE